MSLLFDDRVGLFNQVLHRSPRDQLSALVTRASQIDIGRTLHEIRRLVARYPDLERHVPDYLKRPPRLVSNEPPRSRNRIVRYQPRRNHGDDGPEAA
jgi:hypothetical protein